MKSWLFQHAQGSHLSHGIDVLLCSFLCFNTVSESCGHASCYFTQNGELPNSEVSNINVICRVFFLNAARCVLWPIHIFSPKINLELEIEI